MTFNLRSRILIPSLTLIILLTAGISATSFLAGGKALDKAVESDLDNVSDSCLHQIENFIVNQQDLITVMANQRLSIQALTEGPECAAARAQLNLEFTHTKSVCGYFEDVVLIDQAGMTRSSSTAVNIDKISVAERTYFKEAIRGNANISEVLASRSNGKPIVVIAQPVKSGDTVKGVLLGLIDLDKFSTRFVTSVKVLEHGYVFVYDQNGIFIAHPDSNMVLKKKLSDFPWGTTVQNAGDKRIYYQDGGITKTAMISTSKSLKWTVVATVDRSEGNAAATQIMILNVTLGIIALVIGIIVMWLITRSIVRPLEHIVTNLKLGADQTASAAAQVSSASQTLAEGASEQAASLEETSSSLEEMSSMTSRNSENAQKVNSLAKETRSTVDNGTNDMQAMATAMQEIKASSDDIAKIIKSIDEIAFQTNILALNAAVEAARAGEAGMGFAVVADEVRNLAQRAAHSAKETASKIENAVTKTTLGVELSNRVAHSLQEIVTRIREVDSLAAEVASASKEQAQGLEQVNTAVSQMDKVTQSNAASAEESASASEELTAQAQTLKETIFELNQLLTGSNQSVAADSGDASSTRTSVHVMNPDFSAPSAPKHKQTKSGRSLNPPSRF